MMLQKKSNAWARLKYACVLPLAATAVAVFAQTEISQMFLPSSENTAVLPAVETIFETSLPVLEANQKTDTVYRTVEEMPKFPGGEAALIRWITDHVVYPQSAIEKKIEGWVDCQFIIEKDGSVSNVEVIESRDPDGLDKAAVAVLKKLPKFKPGIENGKTVRVYYKTPVPFKLKNINQAKDQPQTKKKED